MRKQQNDPRSQALRGRQLQLLFEQDQNRFVEVFHRETICRGGKMVSSPAMVPRIPCFTQRVQQAGNQLGCARAGVDHDHGIVIVDVQNRFFSGLEVVGTPSSAGRQ